jgi:hypothetical protein
LFTGYGARWVIHTSFLIHFLAPIQNTSQTRPPPPSKGAGVERNNVSIYLNIVLPA